MSRRIIAVDILDTIQQPASNNREAPLASSTNALETSELPPETNDTHTHPYNSAMGIETISLCNSHGRSTCRGASATHVVLQRQRADSYWHAPFSIPRACTADDMDKDCPTQRLSGLEAKFIDRPQPQTVCRIRLENCTVFHTRRGSWNSLTKQRVLP